MEKTEFPELVSGGGEDLTSTTLNFAAAIKTEEPPPPQQEYVRPGWVKIRRNQTGKTVRIGYTPLPEIDEAYKRDAALEHLVHTWQQHRDDANDALDQSSPYWGMKSLYAPLSDDDLSDSESESESGDESDVDSIESEWASDH
jgi:hypothetical protein